MRRSEWQDRCKRHPEHRLTKGVCPYCLRDRLAHLSASSSSVTATTRASTSATNSPYSSAGSPPLHHAVLSADASSVHIVGAGSSFVNVSSFSQPLMPTSTMKPTTAGHGKQDEASREATRGKEELRKKKKNSHKKKIGRFLSRLVGTEKRRQAAGKGDGGELFHSNTMKEKTSTKWLFF